MEVPSGEDVQEFLFENEFTDGLPVVPCNESKLRWMLCGTDLKPDCVLGRMPPILGSCTVANVAVNAVMAGCKPRHLRVVIAAVQAMLDPDFSLHGLHATTMGATPLIVVCKILSSSLFFENEQTHTHKTLRLMEKQSRNLQT